MFFFGKLDWFVTMDRGSDLMWTWEPLFGKSEHIKNTPKNLEIQSPTRC
jgi:hypothetical protein